jgi:hypothetical protein
MPHFFKNKLTTFYEVLKKKDGSVGTRATTQGFSSYF